MLRYNFEHLLFARGIDKPYTYFVHAGFSTHLATKLKNNKVKYLRPKTIEKLCLLLNCTPNDMMEWYPSRMQHTHKNHALYAIKAKDRNLIAHLTDLIRKVPLDKIEDIQAYIKTQQESAEEGLRGELG